jgi:DNA modification methylase
MLDDSCVFCDQILCGDASQRLTELPDCVVDTIVTSPPYYMQRDYQAAAQVGREETPQDYIDRMVAVLAECHRVLKKSGSLWLVLGDKYLDGRLLGMPWRVALALNDSGWILRSDVIWHKPNAMPSSVKNRPTTDHEYVFFLTKSMDYYYDADAIREPHVTFSEHSRMKGGRRHFFQRNGTPEAGKNGGNSNLHDSRWDQAFHPKGRNKRTVWSIPLSKFRDAHFAVFPLRLSRPVCWPPRPKAAWYSIPSSAAAQPPSWPSNWDATTSASTATRNTAKWPVVVCKM